MFIVYSPEGQSFIGAVQNLPALKVTPTKRVDRVEDTELEGLKSEIDKHQSSSANENSAVNAYKLNQKVHSEKLLLKLLK